MPSNFTLLLDELHAADHVRQRGTTLAKASGGDDWVGDWVRGRRQREAAAVGHSIQANLRTLDRLTGEMTAMAKAMPTSSQASPGEAYTRAYGHFSAMVAAGQFTADAACRIEARFIRISEQLHAAGHL
jgi:hypothetical protein